MTELGTDIEHKILETLVSRIGKSRFDMWFGVSPKIRLLSSLLRIEVENPFAAEWIRNHYRKQIDQVVAELSGKSVAWEIVAAETEMETEAKTVVDDIQDTPLKTPETESLKSVTSSRKKMSVSRSPYRKGIAASIGSVLKNPNASGTKNTKLTPPKLQVVHKQVSPPSAQSKKPIPREIVTRKTSSVAQNFQENTKRTQAPVMKNRQANVRIPNETSPVMVTMENFVEGPSNCLAVRAADLVIRYPGKISPIYIHGSTSVGKTHLLEAIKNQARRNPRTSPPLYLTAEQFTSAFIEGLKQGIPFFRNKFRDISILLVDDIQFFEGKESTQIEFFRTIETLKKQGVQVVLTGNRSLDGLRGSLKPEIITRIEAGMVCEIQPPERETLLQVFRQMVKSRNLDISEEVCRFVVSRMGTHARQLSGALNRLHAILLTSGQPITLASAENALADLIRNHVRSIQLRDIEKAICDTFQLGQQSLQSKSRTKKISHPRMLAMWLARKHTRSALSEIGKFFGNRNHSTVVSAQKKVDSWLNDDLEMDASGISVSVSEVVKKIENQLLS